MNGLRHIFFDLDHTLWDYDSNAYACLQDLFAEFQPEMGVEIEFDAFYVSYQNHNERLWAEYRQDKIDSKTLRRLRWDLAFKDLDIDPGNWISEISVAYVNNCPRKTALMPHAIEVLDALNEEFELHIITNGFSDVQQIKMESSGLQNYFDVVMTSDKAGVKKPHPAIFEMALLDAKAEKSNSIYIGDNYQADVMGAQNVGLPFIYYNSRNRENPGNVPEIQSLKEVLTIVSG